MRKILRHLFRRLMHHYKREHGRYSLLTKIYYPYLAPRNGERENITLKSGIKLNVDSNEYIQSLLYVFGDYEYSTIAFLHNVIKHQDIIIDVGANIGYLSLVCSKLVGTNGMVLSFEPDPLNFSYLKENIALNNANNISAHQLALSNQNSVLKLYHSKIDHNAGAHSMMYNERVVSEDYVEIQAMIFDNTEIQKSIPKVDFIKIDVEGVEMDVLQGMYQTIQKHKPMLLIEISAEYQNMRGLSVKGFKEYLLSNHGYTSYTITNQGYLKKSTPDQFHLLENVVFVPVEKHRDMASLITS